jgi:hypothetical protein
MTESAATGRSPANSGTQVHAGGGDVALRGDDPLEPLAVSALLLLGLRLGGVGDRGRQDDRQHLEVQDVLRAERAGAAAGDDQEADRRAAVEQRDDGERPDPDRAGQRGVGAGVVLGVDAQDGPARADRAERERAAGAEAGRKAEVGRPAGRAGDEVLAVEHRDVGGARARQRARALGDAAHRGREVRAVGGDLALQRDGGAQDGGVDRAVGRAAGAGGRSVGNGHDGCRIGRRRARLERERAAGRSGR